MAKNYPIQDTRVEVCPIRFTYLTPEIYAQHNVFNHVDYSLIKRSPTEYMIPWWFLMEFPHKLHGNVFCIYPNWKDTTIEIEPYPNYGHGAHIAIGHPKGSSIYHMPPPIPSGTKVRINGSEIVPLDTSKIFYFDKTQSKFLHAPF